MAAEKEKNEWFRLDNAGKLFPGIISSRRTTFYRIQAIMKRPVHIGALQKSCSTIINRFPYFKVQLKAGFFWYYFDINRNTPRVEADTRYPCNRMRMTKKGVFPFRIKAFKNVIAVEFSHVLTDGMGALTFLKTLVAEYLRLLDVAIDDWTGIPKADEQPHTGEYTDDFLKYFEKGLPKLRTYSGAYHLNDPLEPVGVYHIITGIVPARTIVSQAKKHKVSVTSFLLGLMFMALQDIALSRSGKVPVKTIRPIRVVIPVNLREIYSSESMHNFFLTVFPEIDLRLGTYTFDEVLKYVHHFLHMEINEKFIRKQLGRNVRGELAIFNRLVPLAIKNIVLKIAYKRMGEKPKTTSLSNLGAVHMPECFSGHIERFDFIPESSAVTKVSCGCISFKNQMSITFGRVISDPVLERFFFRQMVSLGIPVKIITNQGESDTLF